MSEAIALTSLMLNDWLVSMSSAVRVAEPLMHVRFDSSSRRSVTFAPGKKFSATTLRHDRSREAHPERLPPTSRRGCWLSKPLSNGSSQNVPTTMGFEREVDLLAVRRNSR